MVEETAFIDSDNEIEVISKHQTTSGDSPIDFLSMGVTRMDLSIAGTTISSTGPRLTYDDGGVIRINLGGALGIEVGRVYDVSIKVWTPAHPNGQVIVHPSFSNASLAIEVKEATMHY